MTKKYARAQFLLALMSVLLNIGPFAYYVIEGLLSDSLVAEKVGLVGTVFAVAIMTIVSLVNKRALRSRLWILLVGLYMTLDNILTPLIIVAVCQILDELIISPLAKLYRAKKLIHKEMDKRL